MTDRSGDEKRKPTMRERLEAAGFKVRESAGESIVIPGARAVIDIAEIDAAAGKHWLHPSQKLRGNERMAAIRAKHHQRYLDSKKPKP